MPYDAEGRFVYPIPNRKPKKKARNKSEAGNKSVVESIKSESLIGNRQLTTDNPSNNSEAESIKPEINQLATHNSRLTTRNSVPSNNQQLTTNNSAFTDNRQPTADNSAFTELDLAMLWNAQNWPEGVKLATTKQQEVEVIYRGRWSGGFGPDFKGAILNIGGELRRGDVELHLKASGWKAHGHQQDAHYNQVILQVVLENDSLEASQTEAGQHPALLTLLPILGANRLSQIIKQAGASGTQLGSISESTGLCCNRVSENFTDLEKLLEQIDQLGQRRFKDKALLYEAECAADPTNGAVQAFWAGLLEALGYASNKKPFRKLAAVLPFSAILELERIGRQRHEPFEERLLTLEAALLGAAGLLPGQRRLPKAKSNQAEFFSEGIEIIEPLEDWAAGIYVEELERRWHWLERQIRAGSEFAPLRENDWTFARLRPPNHPARRIAGLARWVACLPASNESDWLDWLAEKTLGTPLEICKQLAVTFQVGLNDRESESGQFWTRRFDFAPRALMVGDNKKGASVDLIGSDRAAEIVINIALPFLYGYACDVGDKKLEQKVFTAYQEHPRPGSNELVENIARQVFRYWLEQPGEIVLSGKTIKKLTANRLIETACRQQGLIHLHHQFCTSQDYVNCPLKS